MRRAWIGLCLLLGAFSARAERLPIRIYTSADGLARDYVRDLLIDRDGFVWIATSEGLSRFDGQQFTNFSLAEGVPARDIEMLRQSSSGEIWFTSGGRLCRVLPAGPAPFDCKISLPAAPSDLLIRSDREFWLSTDQGIFSFDPLAPSLEFRREGPPAGESQQMKGLAEDREGTVWATTDFRLYRFRKGGTAQTVLSIPERLLPPVFMSPLIDREGHPWLLASDALYRIDSTGPSGKPVLTPIGGPTRSNPDDGLSIAMFGSDRRLWCAGSQGLFDLGTEPAKSRWRAYARQHGLPDGNVNALAEDSAGNLWLGTTVGVARLAAHGFTSLTAADGLEESSVDELIDRGDGHVCIRTRPLAHYQCFIDGELELVQPRHDPSLTYFGWGWRQTALHAQDGRWWLASGSGALIYDSTPRLDDLERSSPQLVAAGLPGRNLFRLFQQLDGTIWASIVGVVPHIARWDQQRRRFEAVGAESPEGNCTATIFRDSPSAGMWVGCYDGGLLRYRGQQFESIRDPGRGPRQMIGDMLFDQRGRLWIAARDGVFRIDDPSSATPKLQRYGSQQGLASEDAWALLEDERSQIWIGHGRGVDRLDPDSGRIRHFTTADGLAGAKQTVAFRDRSGTLWFGGTLGISARLPSADEPPPPNSPRLMTLSAGGIRKLLSMRGVTELRDLELGPAESTLELRFVSPGMLTSSAPSYEVELMGGKAPLLTRSRDGVVLLPQIAPGSYRLTVHAIDDGGQRSKDGATIEFRVLPPLYARWWFIALMALTFSSVAAAFIRTRLLERIELERVRTRIATDLHDDLGASLSKIAITSELLASQLPREAAPLGSRLQGIASNAREMVESLGDIVWTVDPRLDRLSDLVGRMRHFGGELFLPLGVDFELDAEGADDDRPLGAELRRSLYLAFKETVNNAAKHAGAGRVEAELRIEQGKLSLLVRDDGRGFDQSSVKRGHGLDSLQARAQAVGGTFEIRPAAPTGTEVRFLFPL